MKYPYSIEVTGRTGRVFSFRVYLDPKYIDDYLDEDIAVIGPILNTIPVWAVNMGLTKIWFRVQDIFNFRNPFR